MTFVCNAKHTKYQPPEDKPLVCRKCGNNETFWINELAPGAHDDCTKLHNEDTFLCAVCGFEQSGRSYAMAEAKRLNLVTCKCCKGTGMVKKDSQ